MNEEKCGKDAVLGGAGVNYLSRKKGEYGAGLKREKGSRSPRKEKKREL